MASELSESVRSQIVVLSKEGLSQRQIVDRLKVSKGAVHGTLKRFAETGSVASKARSGRPKVTTPSEDQYIRFSSLTDSKATSSQIQHLINKERGTRISRSTVKRRLSCCGGRAAANPLLGTGTKARRLGWAQRYQHLTVDDWKKVLFTGESTFDAGEGGGGRVRAWGCVAYSGVGHLHRVDAAATEEDRRLVLQRHAVPSGLRLCGPGFILQRDHETKRASELCGDYLKAQQDRGVLTLMDFPPRSPDLNPVQHLWRRLRTETSRRRAASPDALWAAIRSGWDHVGLQVLHRLVESMPARLHAVVEAKGGRAET